ncbi:hypothetical protein ACSBR2_002915 [Camellia fascicularis]
MATRRRPSFLYLGDERENPSSTTPSDTQFDFDESEVWTSSDVVESKKPMPTSRPVKKPTSRKIAAVTAAAAAAAIIDRRPKPSSSLPVKIPDWSKILGESRRRESSGGDDGGNDSGDDEDDKMPPHEYLARTRMASFSVHEGIGRTLKGRDLSRVRNAIWKQIGFED